MSREIRVCFLGDPAAECLQLPYCFADLQCPAEHLARDGAYCVQFQLNEAVLKVTVLPSSPQLRRVREVLAADCAAFVFCFSALSPESLQSVLVQWAVETGCLDEAEARPVFLVGTHCAQLQNQAALQKLRLQRKEPVSKREVADALQKLRARRVFWVQADERTGLQELFEALAAL